MSNQERDREKVEREAGRERRVGGLPREASLNLTAQRSAFLTRLNGKFMREFGADPLSGP